ncbi:nucleotidyltransferase domain-containing protein [Lentibacillus sediminis]|uniref:nucleotidyltransferase domain-containing protein n=1 Tax=Lentibacillus sediminis TaxID=1940529 RepID=UPI000C1B89A1|nr:nucleotidyltransferase domain-containing protein [Lentibacillus sediminis]
MSVHNLLDEFNKKLIEILSSNLTGIYLHGSLAMGCYNQRTSDIDLIIVVKESLVEVQKKKSLSHTPAGRAISGPRDRNEYNYKWATC